MRCSVKIYVSLDDQQAEIRDADGRHSLCALIEDERTSNVFRKTWAYMKERHAVPVSVGLELRPKLPASRKDAVVRGCNWLLRQVIRSRSKAA